MGDGVQIPRDPAARDRLAKMAGLTDEERLAIERWCFDQERERQRGVLLYEGESLAVTDEGDAT